MLQSNINESFDEYEFDDDDDEFGDLLPLVGKSDSSDSSSGSFASRPISSFDIALERHQRLNRYEDEEPSVWTPWSSWFWRRKWAVVGVLIVAFWASRSRRGTNSEVAPSTDAPQSEDDQPDPVLDSNSNSIAHQTKDFLCSIDELEATFEDIVEKSSQRDSPLSLCDESLPVTKEAIAFGSSDGSCSCRPTQTYPMASTEKRPTLGDQWQQIFDQQIERAADESSSKEIDVLFLGDSITEHWLGQRNGKPYELYADILPVYEEFFTKQGGASFDSLVLGIGGETCGNLLWRLQHGALPESLQPKVIWLLVGTNDLNAHRCGADALLAGNVAVLQELQRQRPTAEIVINGLLPFSNAQMDSVGIETNQQIQCWIQSSSDTEKLHYFDTPRIFREETPEGRRNGLLYVDDLHPNVEGYRRWGEAAVPFMEMLSSEP